MIMKAKELSVKILETKELLDYPEAVQVASTHLSLIVCANIKRVFRRSLLRVQYDFGRTLEEVYEDP